METTFEIRVHNKRTFKVQAVKFEMAQPGSQPEGCRAPAQTGPQSAATWRSCSRTSCRCCCCNSLINLSMNLYLIIRRLRASFSFMVFTSKEGCQYIFDFCYLFCFFLVLFPFYFCGFLLEYLKYFKCCNVVVGLVGWGWSVRFGFELDWPHLLDNNKLTFLGQQSTKINVNYYVVNLSSAMLNFLIIEIFFSQIFLQSFLYRFFFNFLFYFFLWYWNVATRNKMYYRLIIMIIMVAFIESCF